MSAPCARCGTGLRRDGICNHCGLTPPATIEITPLEMARQRVKELTADLASKTIECEHYRKLAEERATRLERIRGIAEGQE